MEQQTDTDVILEALERWKKRVIAAFLLLSLLIALTAVLLFELGGVIKVWEMESSEGWPKHAPVDNSRVTSTRGPGRDRQA